MPPRSRRTRRRARRHALLVSVCSPPSEKTLAHGAPSFARARGVAVRVGNVASGAALGVALVDVEEGRRELLRTCTEHFMSVVSTHATRIKHHDMLTRAWAVFLFEHLSVVSNSCSFSTALFPSLETSLAGL